MFLHLYANDGDTQGLFRAGIMSSGFAVPTKDITEIQGTYDFILDKVGCSNEHDTLACLRTVQANTLIDAANAVPGGMMQFFPREDGSMIKMPPMHLPSKGEIADVPIITGIEAIPYHSSLVYQFCSRTGDVKDEGTWFSFFSLNVTYVQPLPYELYSDRYLSTEDEVVDYFTSSWFPGASPADLSTLLELYSSDPAAGSPFDTGNANVFSPQFKRIAAVHGDWFFHGPRRLLLDSVSNEQTTYNFCAFLLVVHVMKTLTPL